MPVFGARAGAALIEGSKSFAKEVMAAAGIPTAEYAVFTEVEPALAWARKRDGRVVVKADGLAAGKGVIIAKDLAQAETRRMTSFRPPLSINIPTTLRAVAPRMAAPSARWNVKSSGRII